MNPTDRFLQVVAELQAAGLNLLVMGGHAVRHYGVERNTLDFDFHLSLENVGLLESHLRRTTPLRKVAPGSPRHLALVEASRRLHKQAAMSADRADKERQRKT